MPNINIQGKDFSYNEGDVINFTNGIIGFPDMHSAVLIPLPDLSPFFWLASVDDESRRFVVVDPNQIFSGYSSAPEFIAEEGMQPLAIVTVFSDWRKTTFNLRAPIFVDLKTKTAAQIILSDASYSYAESLPGAEPC